jgi:HK97 family phage portal protein
MVDAITGRSNLLHLPLFHPTDDFYGFAPISAAAHNIDIHNTSNAWNMKLLQNNAKPSGILVSEQSMDAPQKRRVKSEIRRKWSGVANAGKPALLTGAAWKWIQTSMSPHDMDWLNSQNTSARDICHAFGYPPFLLGLPGNTTFNNMETARLWLWENTVTFYLNFLRDELNVWLMPRYDDGENLFLDYDLSDVPALASRRNSLWDKAEKGKDILSINERRAIVGYAPIGSEGDDIYIPISSVPLSQASIFENEEVEFKKFLVSEGYSNKKALEIADIAFQKNNFE